MHISHMGCGKVPDSGRQGFFMPEKGVPAAFWALPGNFLRGPEKAKNAQILAIFLGGPMGPIHPLWADEET